MMIKLDYNLALAGEQLLHQGLLQVHLIEIQLYRVCSRSRQINFLLFLEPVHIARDIQVEIVFPDFVQLARPVQ